ncbi:MAG: M20/M25/M40 family metallo-hydrolase [Bacteroidales bacterium]|nr:M20/M25/M40 family metallo-hydrolase [Bacteroidales bacterium]MCF8349874.1 M20/M25/M40 family metallo-hydrolase [Bacteroidales bacterium]MCF8376755.1 M20/M25/M40 family metallo-hydrolase [Bacteroidales bacterium]
MKTRKIFSENIRSFNNTGRAGLQALLFLLLFAPVLMAGNPPETKSTDIPGITQDELKGHVYFLASDYMNGRMTGTDDLSRALQYVESQFKAIGLEPHYQEFQLTRKTYHFDTPMTITTHDAMLDFLNGKDYKSNYLFAGAYTGDEAELICVGYGIEEPIEDWNDYENLDLEGKAVIIFDGAPAFNGKHMLSDEKTEMYNSREGRNLKLRNAMMKNPMAIFLVITDDMKETYDGFEAFTEVSSFEYGEENFFTDIGRPFYKLFLAKQEMADRIYSDFEIENGDLGSLSTREYKKLIKTTYQLDLNIRITEQKETSQNLYAILEGSDPILKDEYVTVGAHLDHIERVGGRVCKGADDNASGISGMIEMAQEVYRQKPGRSVVFVAYSGEETGLYGSKHFVENCPVELEKVIVNLNFDCIGRQGRYASQGHDIFATDTDGIPSNLREIVEELNAGKYNIKLGYEIPQRSGTSDHASYIEKGIPAVSFFNGGHQDLHRPTDDPDKLDYEFMERMTEFGYELIMLMANERKLRM